jgi:hypothetical protein
MAEVRRLKPARTNTLREQTLSERTLGKVMPLQLVGIRGTPEQVLRVAPPIGEEGVERTIESLMERERIPIIII